MIQRDTRDEPAVGVDRIDGIQPSSESHFEHGGVHSVPAEQLQRRQRAEFEIRQRHVAARGLDALEGGDDVLVAGRRAVDHDALVIAVQVRRRVNPGPDSCRREQRRQHRDRRALAVRTGDVQHRRRTRRRQPVEHLGHAVQSQNDPAAGPRLEAGQPVRE